MGYRSDITSIIYGEATKVDAFIAKHKLLGNTVFEKFKADLRIGSIPYNDDELGDVPGRMIELTGEGWKWYEIYSDVAAWMTLLTDAYDFGLEYEHIRVGEDYQDTDFQCSPDSTGVLGLSRAITRDYNLTLEGKDHNGS